MLQLRHLMGIILFLFFFVFKDQNNEVCFIYINCSLCDDSVLHLCLYQAVEIAKFIKQTKTYI